MLKADNKIKYTIVFKEKNGTEQWYRTRFLRCSYCSKLVTCINPHMSLLRLTNEPIHHCPTLLLYSVTHTLLSLLPLNQITHSPSAQHVSAPLYPPPATLLHTHVEHVQPGYAIHSLVRPRR